MFHKYLIKPIANKQELEDIRTDFIDNRHDICTMFTDGNSCWYSEVVDSEDGVESMLVIISAAEQYISQSYIDELVTILPDNFIPEEMKEI